MLPQVSRCDKKQKTDNTSKCGNNRAWISCSMQTDISMKRKVLQFQGFVEDLWIINTENHSMSRNRLAYLNYRNEEQFCIVRNFL